MQKHSLFSFGGVFILISYKFKKWDNYIENYELSSNEAEN